MKYLLLLTLAIHTAWGFGATDKQIVESQTVLLCKLGYQFLAIRDANGMTVVQVYIESNYPQNPPQPMKCR